MSFITVAIDAGEIAAARDALGNLFTDKRDLSKVLAAAIKASLVPAAQKLKEITPVGPTGNLRRAVSSKVVSYPKDGGAVGLVGYQQSGKGSSASAQGGTVRAGKDRAFHQWWLEFGTKQRVIKTKSNTPYQRKAHTRRMKSGKVATVSAHQVSGQNAYIASSYNRLGPFKIVDRSTTDPAYPSAFFKKSSEPIRLPAIQPGGIAGQPPVKTAFEQTRGQVAEILRRELSLSLDAALAKVARSSAGTITGGIIQAGG